MDIVEKFFLLRTLVKEENNNVTTKTCKISSSASSKTTGRSKGGNYVTFGEYGLQATTRLGSHLVKSNQLVLQ